MQLTRKGSTPLYRQIERILRDELNERDSAARQGFTENDLMARFGVSRFTVRQALDQLSREGLIERRHRRGTYPSTQSPIEQPLGGVYSFASSMAQLGLSSSSTVLSVRSVRPDDRLQDQLALASREVPVTELVRIRSAAEEPLMIESIWLPGQLVPDLQSHNLTGSIYQLLTDVYGLEVTSAHESIRPAVLDKQQAKLLAVKAGSAAFFVERVSSHLGQPVEVRHSLIRGDRYLFSVELQPRRQ